MPGHASETNVSRPVRLPAVVADGRSDWPTFAREAERLIVEERVCVVFGCWTSASRKAVLPVFEQVGRAAGMRIYEADKLKELQAKWDSWNKGNVDPLWGGKAGGGSSSGASAAMAKGAGGSLPLGRRRR